MATKQQVFDLNRAHPDWTARQIADVLGCAPHYVHKCGHLYELKFAKSNYHYDMVALGQAAKRAGLTIAMIEQMGASNAL